MADDRLQLIEEMILTKMSELNASRTISSDPADSQSYNYTENMEQIPKVDRSSTFMPYQYRPLKEDEIRLLELLPCEDSGPAAQESAISCRLSHYALDKTPPFETLSYCWGTSPSDRIIFVDDKGFYIKPNLEAALKEFRRNHHPTEGQEGHRVLWIDAICIDQENFHERNHQVTLMCRIYSLSKDLVVWLGEEDNSSRIAVQFIRSFARVSKHGLPGMRRTPALRARACNTWAERVSSTPLFPVIFRALDQFLNRPWFRRAWVLQEYILGGQNSTVFQCGGEQAAGDDMETLCSLLQRSNLTKWARQNHVEYTGGRWQELFEAQGHHQRTKSEADAFSILQWLLQARYAEATNPRDKVYAVYGLFEAEHWSGYDPKAFIVDYSATVQDVFSSLVRTLVTTSRRLNIFLACGRRSPLVQRSWTPDWTIQSPGLQFIGRYRCEIKKVRFHAADDFDAAAIFAEEFSSLTVRGLVWDTVATISPPPDESSFVEFCANTWKAIDEKNSYQGDRESNVFLNQTLGSRNEEAYKASLNLRLKDVMDKRRQSVIEKHEEKKGRALTAQEKRQLNKAKVATEKMTSAMAERPKRLSPEERVLVTEKAYIGKDYAKTIQVGDLVCVLLGCPVPIVLRQVQDNFELVRAIYVEGLMYGEAMVALEKGEVELRDFELR